jgi:hypothetical protein
MSPVQALPIFESFAAEAAEKGLDVRMRFDVLLQVRLDLRKTEIVEQMMLEQTRTSLSPPIFPPSKRFSDKQIYLVVLSCLSHVIYEFEQRSPGGSFLK